MVTTLEITKRDMSHKANVLRREGLIPATVYGPDTEPFSIQLDAKNFKKVPVQDHKRLIELKIVSESESIETLIKNIQRDNVSGEILNIEFYKIKRGHELTTKVPLKFVGNSEAVKMGADFVLIHSEANIRCLPRHIPSFLEVSLDSLKSSGDQITFADIDKNENISILEPPKEIICKAESKRKDHTIEPEPKAEAALSDSADASANESKESKT
jgi:large subunit ribosomal protein L25